MTMTSEHSTAIQQCILAETTAMTALNALLLEEQTALVNEEIELLNQSNAAKAELVRKISELENERLRCLSTCGLGADQKGMNAFLRAHAADTGLETAWQNLLTVSAEAKERNHTNGLLINRRMSKNQTALNVLQRGTNTGALYGPNGQSTIKSTPTRGVIVR